MADKKSLRATAVDFMSMGLNLAMLRRLHNKPGGVMIYRDCPNCGPQVLMLLEKNRDNNKVACCSCAYATTEAKTP